MKDYKYDVFISYAHADNEYGWVENLQKHLFKTLRQEIVSEPEYREDRLTRDTTMNRNKNFPIEIENNIKSSRFLLCVLSKKYFHSNWCKRELEIFCERGEFANNHIFLIDICNYREHDFPIPREFEMINCHEFWEGELPKKRRALGYPRPENIFQDKIFFINVLKLAKEIAEEIEATPYEESSTEKGYKKVIIYASKNDKKYMDKLCTAINNFEEEMITYEHLHLPSDGETTNNVELEQEKQWSEADAFILLHHKGPENTTNGLINAAIKFSIKSKNKLKSLVCLYNGLRI